MIPLDEGTRLVRLARESIVTAFANAQPTLTGPSLRAGVFVTISMHGELRGCIGFTDAVMPAYEAVVEVARAAAFHDPRFPPLQENELPDIMIEVSVLTVPKQIKVKEANEYHKLIVVGRDGLIIKAGYRSGLLLPQVAVEEGWDVAEYLRYLCMKAGLPHNAWSQRDTKIYSFQAQVFSESEQGVVEKKHGTVHPSD
jgi:uncharacterized protein